ncbi:hypothetical protein [Nocardia sp. AG03]|uniref:hypothetical protein n=1 Tax=Nocardia sp. AG03 TaxID=3025312 RepID=UPI0024187C27|nr:hypothetical protein [Nocardia sp. AG03]
MPTLVELREQYPNSFGWRVWHGAADGLLRSPVLGTPSPGVQLAAVCPHGNEVPSASCICGVHYVTRAENFFAAVEYMSNPSTPGFVELRPQVYTFGAAIGPTMLDADLDELWLERPTRARVFHILAIMIPTVSRAVSEAARMAVMRGDADPVVCAGFNMRDPGALRDRLEQRYGVPVGEVRYEVGRYGHMVRGALAVEALLDDRDVPNEVAVALVESHEQPAPVHPDVARLCNA